MKAKDFFRSALLILATTSILAMPVWADDVLPPDWRGKAGTITAEWDNWGAPGSGPGTVIYFPDQIIANPGGFDPLRAAAYAYWNSSCNVYAVISGRESVLEVNPGGGLGPLHFGLVNYQYDNPSKLVRLQITSMGPGILDFYVASGPSDPGDPPWILSPTRVDAIVSESYDHGDGWVTRAYDLTFTPNPKWEAIYLDWGYQVGFDSVFIDQVVIDTRCMPTRPAWGGATAEASVHGSKIAHHANIMNSMAVLLIPLCTVLLLGALRRRK